MARALDLRVVAEGVENEGERQQAAALGIDAGQGFLFGKPVDAARVPRLFGAAVTPGTDPLSLKF